MTAAAAATAERDAVAETQTCSTHERVRAETRQLQLLLMFPSRETWENFTPPRQAAWLDVQGTSATRDKASVGFYIYIYLCIRVHVCITYIRECTFRYRHVYVCVCITMYTCWWMNSHVQVCTSVGTWIALCGGVCDTWQCLCKEAETALCTQNCVEKALLNACAFVIGNKNTQHPVGAIKIYQQRTESSWK